MNYEIILIFCAGIIVDLLTTRYTHAVAQKKRWQATILSGSVTLANFALLTVLIRGGAMEGLVNIMAYAGGNTIGTFIALRKA
jgi:hypothetical protein